jgi:hypothetical protein
MRGLCHSSGCLSPVYHRGAPVASPSMVMWDLWWTKWQWSRGIQMGEMSNIYHKYVLLLSFSKILDSSSPCINPLHRYVGLISIYKRDPFQIVPGFTEPYS